MRILNRLGGIELSSAYACIKAISKKKQEIIDQRKVDFVRGAGERGLDAESAEDIFGKIVFFGGYGFNKSHSCAYAYVSYQTAYLKTHYRPEFMAALLSSEIEDGNKRDMMVDHIADARRLGVDVLPPNVNASDVEFTVDEQGRIVFGLTAIKGFGRGAAEEIVRARNAGGLFRDMFDLAERVDQKIVTKGAIEHLVRAGAFDCLDLKRAQAMQLLPRALQAASERQNDRRRGQRNLFGDDSGGGVASPPAVETLADVAEWPETEKLKYEKEALGFYFSSHPLAQHEKELRHFATHGVAEAATLPDGQSVTLGGMMTQVRLMTTKKARNGNSRYARCKLADLSGELECVIWPEDYQRFKDEVYEDNICVVQGTLERKTDRPLVMLTRVYNYQEAPKHLATALWLLVTLKDHGPGHMDAIATLLRETPGPVPVFLTVKDGRGRQCVLKLDREFGINAATFARDRLASLLGPGGVKLA
jgi:DNA polymerase-3 subunit alpha